VDHQRGAQPTAGGVQHLIQGLPLLQAIHERHGQGYALRQRATPGHDVAVIRSLTVCGADST